MRASYRTCPSRWTPTPAPPSSPSSPSFSAAGLSQAVSGSTGQFLALHIKHQIETGKFGPSVPHNFNPREMTILLLQDLLAGDSDTRRRPVLQPCRLHLRFLADNNCLHLPRTLHQLHLLLQHRVRPVEERILRATRRFTVNIYRVTLVRYHSN